MKLLNFDTFYPRNIVEFEERQKKSKKKLNLAGIQFRGFSPRPPNFPESISPEWDMLET